MFPMMIMLLFLLLMIRQAGAASVPTSFSFSGFSGINLRTDGLAGIMPSGLLMLTDSTKRADKGHAFYSNPFQFKNSTTGSALSFSTCFVFAIQSEYENLTGHGMALVLSRSTDLSRALPMQFLGLFNETSNGDPSDQIVAVELDTNYNPEFGDINNNHVGIDANSLRSINSSTASYFVADHTSVGFRHLNLASGDPIQVWVDYDHTEELLNVTLAPAAIPKPTAPLLSSYVNLSSLISDHMYVGFSSSTGMVPVSHYILGWSFTLNGRAQTLDLSRLPSIPLPKSRLKFSKFTIIIIGPLIVSAFVVLTVLLGGAAFIIRRKMKFAELLENWELEYGPQRYSYKDIYTATNGFSEKQLLGAGGFGRVYRGVLPRTNLQVAVKKVSHESRQGLREFVAEIISIGRLRHRNLVQLHGYCRRRGELLLLYEHMPNGSLDRFLFDRSESMLNWRQRFNIIRGVASGLFYLHEEWEQAVIHRDIKASNILLDRELNGRLGDFGLARLYDHGTDPQTTHVVGTLGYLAPELPRTGKATTRTDVYAFGGFLLEVACGRRPIETRAVPEEVILVDWVLECWKRGNISEVRDPNLGNYYSSEEMEMVLKLGLLCSHPNPAFRPRMRLVMQILDGNAPLPENIPTDGWEWDASSSASGLREDYFETCTMKLNMVARSAPLETKSETSELIDHASNSH